MKMEHARQQVHTSGPGSGSPTDPSRSLRGRPPALAALLPALLLAASLVLLLLPGAARAIPAQTDTTIVLQGEVKQQVETLEAQAAQVQADIDRLDTDLEVLSEEYNALSLRLEAISGELHELRSRLRETQEVFDYRRAQMDERLVETYKSGGDRTLEILLSAEDFTTFVKRLVLLYHINTEDRRVVDNFEYTLDDIAGLEAAIRDKKAEELTLRNDLDQKQVAIEASLAERKETLAGLDARVAELIEQERLRQEEERRRLEEALRARLAGWEMYRGPLPQTDDVVLNQVVQTAAAYLGIPYVWAGELPSTGMDCSGFTLYVLRQHGVRLPHYSGYQAQMGVGVAPTDIRPGDLLAFGDPVHHVGLYIGDGLFIHAPRTGDVIKISRLAARGDLNTIRRFPLQPRVGPPALD